MVANEAWTLIAWIEHERELRAADLRTLELKWAADQRALELARQIQVYKDEKANQLREQISSERGEYLTRTEYAAQHQNLLNRFDTVGTYMSSSFAELNKRLDKGEGVTTGEKTTRATITAMILAGAAVLAAVGSIIALALKH